MDEKVPINVDMLATFDAAFTVGTDDARIVKVKHQGFEETVKVLNSVLKKMNADVELRIVPKIPEPNGKHHSEPTEMMT